MALTFKFEDEELAGLQQVFRRACSTWEPADQPKWIQDVIDAVDARLAKLGQGPGPVPRPARSEFRGMLALYEAGIDSAKRGQPQESNPGVPDTPEFKSWSNGWTAGAVSERV